MIPLGLLLAASGARCIPVETDRILAKDIATQVAVFSAIPADTLIGYAPAPGATRIINSAQLSRLAKRYDLRLPDLRDLCFERASELLTPERIAAAIESSLEIPGAPVVVGEFLHGRVPKGQLVFPRSGLEAATRSKPDSFCLWRGYVRFAGNKRFPIWARVRIPSERLPGQTCVQRGDPVNVEVQIGAARLQFDGRAESSAACGDPVSVRNPSSGKLFRAIVEAKGRVGLTLSSDTRRPQ